MGKTTTLNPDDAATTGDARVAVAGFSSSSSPPSNERPSSPSAPPSVHSVPPPPYTQPSRDPLAAQIPNRSGTATFPAAGPRNRKLWTTNTILRIVCLGIAIIGISLFIACIATWGKVWADTGSLSGIGVGVLAYSILESVCILTADIILVRRKKAPVHPAIPLTFDLLGWMGIIACSVLLALFTQWGYECDSDLGPDCPEADFMTSAERAGVAMSFFVGFLHFVLFVRACRDVHHQREEIRQMKASLRAYVEMT